MKSQNEMWNANGRGLGFRPALLDFATMRIYPAPMVPKRGVTVRGTLVAGFERGGFFYTRRAMARACEEWCLAN